MINIGMRIKELRMGRNLTQAALGRKINRSKTVISNYEMGIRSELIKDRLHAELTLFYMDIQDIQLTTFAKGGSGRMITNGGKADSYGVEVSLRSRIAEGLTADLNYGFTRATFRDYKTLDKNETEINYKDNFIPYTPRSK